MQDHSIDVVATKGIRSHMGENVKLTMVAGIHTLHRACQEQGSREEDGWGKEEEREGEIGPVTFVV